MHSAGFLYFYGYSIHHIFIAFRKEKAVFYRAVLNICLSFLNGHKIRMTIT